MSERKPWPLGYVGLALLFFLGCSGQSELRYRVTAADSGKTFSLLNGERLQLTLAENPTTGYAWEITSAASPALETAANEYRLPSCAEGMVGCPGQRQWIFVARSQAEQSAVPLRLEYRHPWEKGGAAEGIFTLQLLIAGAQ